MLSVLTLLAALSSAEVLTPADAVRAALKHDPALVAREAELDAARGLQRQTLFLGRNPVLEVAASRDRSRTAGSLKQPFSVTGEGIHAGRSARAGLEAAKASLDRARFETAASTRRAYALAVNARERLRFANADRLLLERLRGIAEARVNAGEGADLDLRLARLEEARAVAALLEAQAEATQFDVELSGLIGKIPGPLLRDPLSAGPERLGVESPRSDLIAARAAARSAQAALSRERAARFPTLELGVFYEKDGGVEIHGPTLALEFPLWNWNQSGVGAARGALRVAKANEVATVARAATETELAAERLRVAEASVTGLVSDISAEAEPALRAIERLFNSGEANLSETLVLRSRVVEGERAWLEARAAVAIARIDVALTTQSSNLLP